MGNLKKCFFCHQPCISFPLTAVKLSAFRPWSSHHFQQLHLHTNELSHSYYNYFAEAVVLSPTCFLFSPLISPDFVRRGPEFSMKVQLQQQTWEQTEGLYKPILHRSLKKQNLSIWTLVYSAVHHCLHVLWSMSTDLCSSLLIVSWQSPFLYFPELAVQSI